MKRILLVCLTAVFAFASSELWAQEQTISGTVASSDDGSGLPGVNVVVKGTTNGTVTDANGKYSVSAPADGTLVFTFIGLTTQEVAIGGRSVVDVKMSQDVQQLSEVIVTAQGIMKTKNELSYAAQSVEGDALAKSRDNNFVNAMSGKVSGVQIQKNNSMGGSTNVIIRGFKSLTGNNQALFVVDGVPIDNSNRSALNSPTSSSQTTGISQGTGGFDYGNGASDINPDDIASMNVLKGPAATALYGSRASNGVIMITTKKGRKKGLGVTLNTGVTVGKVDKSTLPTYQKEYGGGYGQYYGPDEDAFFNEDAAGNLYVPTYEDASFGGKFDPNLMVYQWGAFGDPTSPTFGQKTPWVGAANDPTKFFETSVGYNNNVMIDGGNEKGYFKLGYTRNEEKGIMPNSKIQKDFINFSTSYEVAKNLTASASVNFTNTNGRGRFGTGYDGANGRNVMTSFRQWWQVNTDVKELKNAYFRNRQNVTWNWSSAWPDEAGLIYWDNPYWVRYENYETDNRSRYLGNAMLEWTIKPWLKAMGRVSLDSYNETQEERIAKGSIGVANYTRRENKYREYNYDGMLTFDKSLNDDFSLRAVLGANVRRTTIQGIDATTNGGLLVSRVYALSNSLGPLQPPTETFSDVQVNGAYANTTLGFKEFLFVDLAYRRDVASSLPKKNNAYNYGSGSLSFVFSELMENSPWLHYGKIRANYAEVGNTAPFNALVTNYDKPSAFAGAFGTAGLFSVPGTRNNPDLKPERTKSTEFGLEMAFLDGRVGFDATYYISTTVDQILPLAISTATGYNSKFVNAGEIENKGIELTLNGTPVKTDAFTWDISVNWTRNRNMVKALYPGSDVLQIGSWQGGVTANAAVNEAYGALRGTAYVDVDGKPTADVTRAVVSQTSGNYLRTTTTNNNIGNIMPNWLGGITNTVRYKDVSLSFLVDIKHGGDVYSVDMYYGLGTGLYEETAGLNELGNAVRSPRADGGGVLYPGLAPDGSPNTIRKNVIEYPGLGVSTKPMAGYIYDASYVKLREVSLSYSFPASLIERLSPLRSVTLSAVGRNLWIIHKNLPYADPEDNLGAGNVQGAQIGALPNVRTVGFNLKATF
jgi:TonB-linked SusC/RagA family outer membrane protein